MNKYSLISVIIAVLNGIDKIEETILSIINQTYPYIELIVIDGGSTDGTIDILKKYNDKISYWVSEPDKGISDAFNKGVKASTGTYINFQGDGDGFYNQTSLEKVMDSNNSTEDIFISGLIQRIDIDDTPLYVSKYVGKFSKKSLLFRMSLPHQGLFTHESYFEKYGLFDVNNTFCMDYEHLLRAYKEFPKVVTKDVIVANWRADGIGNGRTLEIFTEYDKIKRMHKIANPVMLTLINLYTHLKYYVKRVIGK